VTIKYGSYNAAKRFLNPCANFARIHPWIENKGDIAIIIKDNIQFAANASIKAVTIDDIIGCCFIAVAVVVVV